MEGLEVPDSRRIADRLLPLDHRQIDDPVALARGHDNGFTRVVPQCHEYRFYPGQPGLAVFDGLRDVEKLSRRIDFAARVERIQIPSLFERSNQIEAAC